MGSPAKISAAIPPLLAVSTLDQAQDSLIQTGTIVAIGMPGRVQW